MKKYLIAAVAALAFVGCARDDHNRGGMRDRSETQSDTSTQHDVNSTSSITNSSSVTNYPSGTEETPAPGANGSNAK